MHRVHHVQSMIVAKYYYHYPDIIIITRKLSVSIVGVWVALYEKLFNVHPMFCLGVHLPQKNFSLATGSWHLKCQA